MRFSINQALLFDTLIVEWMKSVSNVRLQTVFNSVASFAGTLLFSIRLTNGTF